MTSPSHRQAAPTSLGAASAHDRVVHASLVDSADGVVVEIVRYDRQGRWYKETSKHGGRTPADRQRYGTVHEAAQQALEIEAQGGTIHIGRAGGKQFDAKVAGARGRKSRR